jgi:predicted PurR-regulated permease PerM
MTAAQNGRDPPSGSRLPREVVVLLLIGLVLLAIKLADVLLLTFGAVLTAMLLTAVAEPFERRFRMGRGWAMLAAVTVIVLTLAAVLILFGADVSYQVASLSDTLPLAWRNLETRLSQDPLGVRVLGAILHADVETRLFAQAPSFVRSGAGALATTVIVLFAGFYVAMAPKGYLRGLLSLFPTTARPRALEVLGACGLALRQWLIAQLVSMLVVGVTTGLALWAAGAPSPVALGLLAGLGQFVPVVGPMAAAVVGLLLSLLAGPQTFAWAIVIYVAGSQLESNLLSPLVLRQMANLPMAVSLFAVLALGVLLGPLGVLFATPLAVVIYVAVKMLWVDGALGGPSHEPR